VLELQRDDVGAVMDAAGSQDAIVFGGARAAPMAMLFAATYGASARTSAACAAERRLIEKHPLARSVPTDDRDDAPVNPSDPPMRRVAPSGAQAIAPTSGATLMQNARPRNEREHRRFRWSERRT
jgi:pimeloyl-ACP methyl ester carboxylesterase